MTNEQLRDHFAGLVVQAVMQAKSSWEFDSLSELSMVVAEIAYSIADAMIVERAKEKT